MAKKKMIFNHWPNGQGKGCGNKVFDYAWQFADYLKDAVRLAVEEIATNISSAPETTYGASAKVAKLDGSESSVFALNFATTENLNSALGGNKHGHANAYARHFTATTGKTTHMDYGNLVEQAAYKKIMEWHNEGFLLHENKLKYDFLYNDPNAHLNRFTVSYNGATKSARPDFRVSLVPMGLAAEAIYDITSLGDKGHILKKKVNTKTLDQIPGIVVGYEIFYVDGDVYEGMEK